MIYLDSRIGSKDLLPLMPKNSAELTHLEFADAAFLGRGVDEVPISIGIERKRINDLIQSMTTNRLSGYQIPGLTMCYDIVYIIIEGIWRANPRDGVMEKPGPKGWRSVQLGPRRFMAREIWSYLNTLQLMTGIKIWKTGSARETTQWIANLYAWWNNKALDEHKSHLAPYVQYAQLSTKKPPIVQRVASQLTGVGLGKSKAITKKFKNLMSLVMADKKEWQNIEGVGKVLSEKIMKEIHDDV